MGQEAGQPERLSNPYSGQGCFFCGRENPIGLKLEFQRLPGDPPQLRCRWTPGELYRGLGSVLHGGIQCGIFDEIMGWTTHHLLGSSAVTGSLQIKFHRPVPVGSPLEVLCSISGQKGRQVELSASLTGEDGQVCTSATGTYVLVAEDKFREIMGPSE